MKKGDIAREIGIVAPNLAGYIRNGVIPYPPLCYKEMNLERLACYIRICQKKVKVYRESRRERHISSIKACAERRKNGIRASYKLPAWTEKARGTERELYLD